MKRILIADDQPAARELLRTVLTSSGYEVFEASDGVEAAEKAKTLLPDLILLDIHMPGQDGFAACATIRGNPALVSVPVIALTAGLMSGEREKALTAGFTDFMAKPVSVTTLRKMAAKFLGSEDGRVA